MFIGTMKNRLTMNQKRKAILLLMSIIGRSIVQGVSGNNQSSGVINVCNLRDNSVTIAYILCCGLTGGLGLQSVCSL